MELQQEEWKYGGFWRRFLAYVLDTFIISIPLGIIYLLYCSMIIINSRKNAPQESSVFAIITNGEVNMLTNTSYVLLLIGFVISVIYFTVLHASKLQATVGKLAFGLIVVDESGNRITLGRSLGRYFAAILSTILYIGYIIAVFTKRKQAFHDIIARTYVIKRPC
ncbi:RDD family protein [Heyndrickxia acidicola]|jgi:uncharacterized RDD family membrane protein YckC|uniref:RDD family protein n=1 Tax=Heyndrickxia acidicola TaxID=209389 RepID=A0ABU6MIN8_9BACI|nr:RDD family protein [Heyndrickxia acidicola]MED1204262.1 RDD family protein [Heyndrickxia acidicola]